MLDDPDDLAILVGCGLAGLGCELSFHAGREVIARRGGNRRPRLKMLLRLGCDLAQGYGIARPMPAGRTAGALAWLAMATRHSRLPLLVST
jgi:predicted signal transduction protein with EAL and GGDEF domain